MLGMFQSSGCCTFLLCHDDQIETSLLSSGKQQYKNFVDCTSSDPFAVRLDVVLAFTLRNTTEEAHLWHVMLYLFELLLLDKPKVFL